MLQRFSSIGCPLVISGQVTIRDQIKVLKSYKRRLKKMIAAQKDSGFFAEAIADWASAVDLEPVCGDAYYNLARALSHDGRRPKPGAPRTETAPKDGATADRPAKDRVSSYADFFCLAQRFLCAAAIFSRAAAERTRFLLVVLLAKADAEGRPLRFAPDRPARAFRAS
jgi:tetratricopeptide (TPR) repeat protein